MHTAKVLRIAGGTVSSAVSMFIRLKLYAFQTALQHKQILQAVKCVNFH
jgi:hypothetical protein